MDNNLRGNQKGEEENDAHCGKNGDSLALQGDDERTHSIPHSVLVSFSEDVGSLWCSGGRMAILEAPPPNDNPFDFLREYVSKSKPCIIQGAMNGLQLNVNDLEDTLQQQQQQLGTTCENQDKDDLMLTVDVTPDGHGDVVRYVSHQHPNKNGDTLVQPMFVKPKDCQMSFSEFVRRLRSSRPVSSDGRSLDANGRIILPCHSEDSNSNNGADKTTCGIDMPPSCEDDPGCYYYSRQNDCLRTELKRLFDDTTGSFVVPSSFPWAEKAFGTGPPDAINLWIGNERAVSAMHKDHYENLFYVLSGEKIFTLCPPADAPFLYQNQEFESGMFEYDSATKTWWVSRDKDGGDGVASNHIRWSEADVTNPSHRASRFPLVQHTHPIEVRVRAGEMLYLPALWFHRVTQSCETVGINYWYDMAFDGPLWCYYHLLEQMETTGTTRQKIIKTKSG